MEKDTTGIQMDRARDTKCQRRKWTETQMDRDTDRQGLGHRWTGIGTETNEDIAGQIQGDKQTGTQKDRKRERDTDGQS